MMTKTTYSAKELQRMAVKAIKDDAKAAGVRAKFTSWSLEVRNDSTILVAYGETRHRNPGEHTNAFSARTAI